MPQLELDGAQITNAPNRSAQPWYVVIARSSPAAVTPAAITDARWSEADVAQQLGIRNETWKSRTPARCRPWRQVVCSDSGIRADHAVAPPGARVATAGCSGLQRRARNQKKSFAVRLEAARSPACVECRQVLGGARWFSRPNGRLPLHPATIACKSRPGQCELCRGLWRRRN